ncbi:hypothetical protein TREMEDRAFT_66599 [Tremella mesenterica DSM 1558]|uniref:uncharacterized protein n=1 Tax=Tremella mesenterica (strain ATCC 24925 / CBS 8224 / DSM 1558 / NBRC 9311 / NRRL Y-6157 / RJB 2259-6 / UBC 559-6) TaxID=578456 RepID=UPI00032D514C|nr:uncharacterized protein TREMEDRAFT_66599 [Tremella mesenterica DSM 1558]EIW65422.1 hypothetical protein TREMEDRAFT_66599 [Tremella mesenterica DSM 1558]
MGQRLIPFETVSEWAKGSFLFRQSQNGPLKSPENSSDSPEIPQSRVVTRTCAYSNFNSTWITKSIRIDTAERTGLIPFGTVSEWAKVGLIPFETVSEWAKVGLIPFETVSEWTKGSFLLRQSQNGPKTGTAERTGLIPFETVSEWAKVGLIPFETVSEWAKGSFLLRQSQNGPKVDSFSDSLRMPLKSPENSSDSPEIPQSRVVTRTCAYSNFNRLIPFGTVSEWAKGSFLLRQSQNGPKVDSFSDSLRMPVKSPENSSDSPEIPWARAGSFLLRQSQNGPNAEFPQSQVVTRTWAYSNFNSTWITKSIRIDAAERTGLIPFETVSEWAKG